VKAVFAVLDRGANLVTFTRMDDAWLASNELALAKARASVMFRMPSEALNAPLQVGVPAPHFDHVHAGGLLLMGGGIPLFDAQGALLGARGGVRRDAGAGCGDCAGGVSPRSRVIRQSRML